MSTSSSGVLRKKVMAAHGIAVHGKTASTRCKCSPLTVIYSASPGRKKTTCGLISVFNILANASLFVGVLQSILSSQLLSLPC